MPPAVVSVLFLLMAALFVTPHMSQLRKFVSDFTFPFLVPAGSQQPGVPYYTDPGGPVMNPMAMAFHVQPNSPQGNPVYPPPPSYCNTPPPPYEQVVKSST
uniref:WW domain binding protein VOPP1 n=1 Tax=Pavo cristatus TaxID=9049 RepID=A0A8C9G1J3_PAVCR